MMQQHQQQPNASRTMDQTAKTEEKQHTIVDLTEELITLLGDTTAAITSLKKKIDPIINEHIVVNAPGELYERSFPVESTNSPDKAQPRSLVYSRLEHVKSELIRLAYWIRSIADQAEL